MQCLCSISLYSLSLSLQCVFIVCTLISLSVVLYYCLLLLMCHLISHTDTHTVIIYLFSSSSLLHDPVMTNSLCTCLSFTLSLSSHPLCFCSMCVFVHVCLFSHSSHSHSASSLLPFYLFFFIFPPQMLFLPIALPKGHLHLCLCVGVHSLCVYTCVFVCVCNIFMYTRASSPLGSECFSVLRYAGSNSHQHFSKL